MGFVSALDENRILRPFNREVDDREGRDFYTGAPTLTPDQFDMLTPDQQAWLQSRGVVVVMKESCRGR